MKKTATPTWLTADPQERRKVGAKWSYAGFDKDTMSKRISLKQSEHYILKRKSAAADRSWELLFSPTLFFKCSLAPKQTCHRLAFQFSVNCFFFPFHQQPHCAVVPQQLHFYMSVASQRSFHPLDDSLDLWSGCEKCIYSRFYTETFTIPFTQ